MANTILLVDDVVMFLDIQKSFLKLSSAKILTAGDGEEALALLREHEVGLIFMDLYMPKLNGADCCRRIKANPVKRHVPVILITSAGKEEDRQVCIQSGCDDFLTKPLDRDLFLTKARKYLPAIERREPRIPVSLPAKFKMYGLSLSGTIRDISTRGVYIAADYPVEAKSVVEVTFFLPDEHKTPVAAQGRVSWVNTGKERTKAGIPPGFGVEFVVISPSAMAAIAAMIDAM